MFIKINEKNTRIFKMLMSDQFNINEAWIAIRINDLFSSVRDNPYDIYVLMDAASTYVFGHILLDIVNVAPQKEDVENLFRKAWETKRQWPDKLIMAEHSIAENVFRTVAEKNGFTFSTVSLSDLSPIVAPLKESFASTFR
jgi:hypothetical protein